MIVDRVQQSAHDQVQHGNAVANPDAHRIGARAETCFGFECRASKRETFATEIDCMSDD